MHHEESTSIIKADRLGRTHYTAQYKQEVLAAFAESSLSGPAFARQCGIKYSTFASWVSKRRKTNSAPEPSGKANPFVIAEFGPEASDQDALEIQLPGGAIVHARSTHQVALLADLLKALA